MNVFPVTICCERQGQTNFLVIGITESWANIDAESWANIDAESWANIDAESWANIDAESWANIDAESWANIDAESWANIDAESWANIDAESWANIDITDDELGLTGYVMFRKDRIGRRGGGVILYVKESIQVYEIKLEREADCDEAVLCKIVSGNSKLTIGLVYRSPNINEEDNTKIKTL